MLIIPVASVCPIGRGGGWLAALLWGERTREGRLHVPGHHPTLPAVQVTPDKSLQISSYHPMLNLPYFAVYNAHPHFVCIIHGIIITIIIPMYDAHPHFP